VNSKRVVFLLLAVIVAGATAFLARAWLQAERAAIVAQAGGQRQVALPKPSTQVLVARTAIRTGQLIRPEDPRWQPWPPGNA
jgi:pilus assembly protein CpaB